MKTVLRLALLGPLALAGAAGPARAEAPKGARTVYTNRTAFSLPVRIDERDRADLKEVKFYVKAVRPGRPGDWACRETAPPTQSKFAFRAAEDGEYWFAFVTADQAGNLTPADLDKEPPGLVVVVDTRAPEVDVRAMTALSGETLVQCDVRDANPDPAGLRVEYQARDKSWRPLEPVSGTPGLFRAPAADAFTGAVRATATDRAGNKATRDIELGKPPSDGPAIAQAAPVITKAPPAATPAPAAPPPPPPPPAPSLSQSPVGTMLTSATSPAPAPAAATRRAERAPGPVAVPEPRPPVTESAPPSRTFVNSRRCALDYALDTPNVVRVEAYATRDGGKTWARVGDDTDRRSPIEFTLPEDGVYGIALVVSTAAQPGGLPAAGDAPDTWVEVDTVRPEVLVHGVQAGTGPEARVLTVIWSAQDRNPAADAVEVHAAARPDGPWQPLVRGLRDKGTVQCVAPPDLGSRVYLRVQAADRAGNVGRWETREPILLEGAKPKARVLGVGAGRGS